jgi:hypothetical protein
VGHRFPILRNEKDDRRLASQITEATLRSWKVVCEPHIKGISGNVLNIDPVLFLNQMKDEGSTMIMIPWKSVLKYLNCLKFTKDENKLNFDDFVEKNTGIQTYIYKIRNFLFKMDPTFDCQRIQNIRRFCLESRTPYIRLLIFWCHSRWNMQSNVKGVK